MCITLNGFAFLQKLMGWAIVILVAQDGLSVKNIIGAFLGLTVCECADIWYKYTEQMEKSA